MALKALDIYKLLPKTNCKKCGFPTCLAFAMKIASGKIDIDLCPCIDEKTKALIGGATRPPVRLVRVGVGERSFAVGEEFVLFRHEKTFYHQPGIIFEISDTMEEERVRATIDRVNHEVLHRIGQDLLIDGIAFRNTGKNPDTFGNVVALAEKCASLPEVICADEPAAQEAALSHCGNFRPLIHAATAKTYKEFAELAHKYGCPLTVRAHGPKELTELVEKVCSQGIENIMLDPAPASLQEYIAFATEIRRRAVERSIPELGYPIVFDTVPLSLYDASMVLGILKYASVIITPELPESSTHASLTLRQNIYTDPQKPIQVTPGIYPIHNPGRSSPVLLTVNFSLTYFTLLGYLEALEIPSYMFVVDTEGMSVLTSVAGGKLTADLVQKSITTSGVENMVDHRILIIPGYAAPLSGKIEDETGWKVLVGPRDAAEIGEFLEKEWRT